MCHTHWAQLHPLRAGGRRRLSRRKVQEHRCWVMNMDRRKKMAVKRYKIRFFTLSEMQLSMFHDAEHLQQPLLSLNVKGEPKRGHSLYVWLLSPSKNKTPESVCMIFGTLQSCFVLSTSVNSNLVSCDSGILKMWPTLYMYRRRQIYWQEHCPRSLQYWPL